MSKINIYLAQPLFKSIKIAKFIFIMILLPGCRQEDHLNDHTVNYLYNKGYEKIKKKSYSKAASYFKSVYFQHPQSEWANKAALMEMYSLLLAKEYMNVVEKCKDFLLMHPGYQNNDYVTFLAIYSHSLQMLSCKRDQTYTNDGINLCKKFLEDFPSSKYVVYVKKIYHVFQSNISAASLVQARIYQEMGLHSSAILVMQNLYENKIKIEYMPELVYRMVMSYIALHQYKHAQMMNNILQSKYARIGNYQNNAKNKWANMSDIAISKVCAY
jgi:outer membrane protein assembly factor BamD